MGIKQMRSTKSLIAVISLLQEQTSIKEMRIYKLDNESHLSKG